MDQELIPDVDSQKTIYQNKIDNLISNYEHEKEIKHSEIKELNNKLVSLTTIIDQQAQNLSYNESKISDLTKNVEELSIKNEGIIKEIEEKLETFEQIKKLDNSELKEDDINIELSSLEKKYDDMVNNWEEYSGQAKSRVEELKTSIDTKKKEYGFKYEKIGSLKKEIDEISTKIQLKQELAGFLNEEYQKIPVDINRNKFITKISDLTGSTVQERHNIVNYNTELKNSENQILTVNDTIKRVDNDLEEKLFQEVKTTPASKELYAIFIKIREGYNAIQKNIFDSQILKSRVKELENKVEDYQQKLKSYDYNQLKEQVDNLKLDNANSAK